MTKALVTGGAGFIGSHLCNQLIATGKDSVIAVDNLRSGLWSRVNRDVERLDVDINELDESEWINLLSDVDVVYHLAAEKYNSSKSTPEKVIQTNVNATERIARASAIVGVRRLVFTSSLYAYGSMGPKLMTEGDEARPNTLYGASKLMGEGILRSISRELSLSWNVARLFFVYGPKQYASGGYKSVIISNFERIIAGDSPIICGDGRQTLDYVFIEDCINGLVALAESSIDSKIVNIASGIPLSINELTKQMMNISGFKGEPVITSPDWTQGTSRWGSTYEAAHTFGLKCATPIEHGLNSVYEWMRDNA
jgi:UDP-glucose 4-epimerase